LIRRRSSLLSDIPDPKPNNGEVVVHVKATGVRPWDTLIRSGKNGYRNRFH
jgi:NADPH:quinone reductase-like Zn-dependent oxidoreductase